jgi:hypothetical protein
MVVEIANWDDLDAVRDNLSDDYLLVNDLDQNTAGYDTHVASPDKGWDLIGDRFSNEFAGAFDGNGNQISDLVIGRPTEGGAALFASNSGTIRQLDVVNCDVTGRSAIGPFVGRNSGKLIDCSASGTVSGNSRVGGLVGTQVGTLRNSHYDLSKMTINGGTALTPGGLFPKQYQDWQRNKSLRLSDYDSLVTNNNRIEIENVQGVRDALGFTQDPDNNWRLTADLDLAGAVRELHIPHLAGDLDGNGHTVRIDIDQPGTRNLGLIAFAEGAITDLIVVGAVSGGTAVGGLVGKSNGSINGCVSTAEVTGGSSAGGLVGIAVQVDNCVARGDVTADPESSFGVGGLAARLIVSANGCAASGDVSGANEVGGLIGANRGVVTASYATGAVDGTENVGGLVGENVSGGSLSTVYATGAVRGTTNVGGVVGRNDASTQDAYWDTSATGQGSGIGTGSGSVTGLQTAKMQGSSPKQNMSALDFEQTWLTVSNPDNYPRLRPLTAELSLSVLTSPQQIAPDGTMTISVEASQHDRVVIDDLWTDWEITAIDAAGATVTTDTAPGDTPAAGQVVFEWPSVQSYRQLSVTLDLPQRYQSGTYLFEARANDNSTTERGVAVLEISD